MSTGKNVKVKNLRRFEHGHTKAYVDIVLFKYIQIRNCRIIEGDKGLFVSLPQEPRAKDGKWYPIVNPVNKEAENEITEAVLGAYKTQPAVAVTA